MNRKTLLGTSAAFLVLLMGSSAVLADLVVPHRLSDYLSETVIIEGPRAPQNLPVVGVHSHGLFPVRFVTAELTSGVFTPREAVARIQDRIEGLILDDAIGVDFGNGLLIKLDHVIDDLEDEVRTKTSLTHLREIQDDVGQGITDGDIGADDGNSIVGMLDGVLNLL